MSRLFAKEFHEHSSLWYFKTSIISLKRDDLKIVKYLDEKQNLIMQFSAVEGKKDIFPAVIDIIYNLKKNRIISHKCSICNDELCSHYFSVLSYGHEFFDADKIQEKAVKIFRAALLNYNELWQKVEINGKIEIRDLYEKTSDKVRFYFSSYKPMRIKIISELLAGKLIKDEDKPFIIEAEKQLKALSLNEQNLLKLLQSRKASYSKKYMFFSIYKTDMTLIFPLLKNLSYKTYIEETGERFIFSEDQFTVNFIVMKKDSQNYILRNSAVENISAVYSGHPTYILKKNVVHRINFPFKKRLIPQLFDIGISLKKEDLVYISTVIVKQLGILGCHLDFAENIKLPKTYYSKPIIELDLFKKNDSIHLIGRFKYDENIKIPLSIIKIDSELYCCNITNSKRWFYLPPEEKYDVMEFLNKLPNADVDNFDSDSELVFSSKEKITKLKEIIYEQSKSDWEINLTEELKKEFIFKVVLAPKIITKKTDKTNWFEYEVVYNYKDIKFTHNEIKRFFKGDNKYMELKDGRLLYFENIAAFNEVEKVLKKSKKLDSHHYRLSIYNIPYLYQIKTINQMIETKGDAFLKQLYRDLLNRKLSKDISIPHFLNGVMRSYQKEGFRWLMMLNSYNLEGILADDMGLGKTLQTIALLSIMPPDSTSLVICPKTLLYNWADEIKKFNNSLTYVIYEGPQQKRKKLLEKIQPNVILASYSIVINDISLFEEREFHYVILDEAQHIKNPYTIRASSIKKLNSRHKLCLTGTPVQNNPVELWSIFDFLMPGFLPSRRQFKEDFFNSKDDTGLKRLKQMIAPFILRRTKENVLVELPDKQVQTIFAKPTELQEKLYLQGIDEIKKNFNFSENSTELKKNYIGILAMITKLRLISNHPHLVDSSIKKDTELSGKTETLLELIKDALGSNKKILIFSQFVKMLQIIKGMLKKNKIIFSYMDGSSKNRKDIIDEFNNNNNIRIFLVSLKTGGYGINLTSADTVIIVDPWWNPMEENQAIDRAHRMGQTKKVNVYKIITKGTIEEKILMLQRKKWNMFDSLINDGQSIFDKLSLDDIRGILEYSPNE